MGLLSRLKKAAKNVGNAVASATGTVGNAIQGGASIIGGTARDLVNSGIDSARGGLNWTNEWLCRNAGRVGCIAGNVVLGAIGGVLEGVRDILVKAANVLVRVGRVLGALLRGDLPGFLSELLGLVFEVVDLVLAVARLVTLTAVWNGIVEAWEAEELRRFVSHLVDETFVTNPDLRTRVRANLKLDETGWGFPLRATHRVFRFDSALVPLAEWHNRGLLDLYALAGQASFDSFSFVRPRAAVKVVNDDGTIEQSFPVTRWQIASHLETGGKSPRLRLYAMSNEAIQESLAVAVSKYKRLGINLTWNDGELGRWDVPTTHDVRAENELEFVRSSISDFVVQHGYRSEQPDRQQQCEVLAFGALRLNSGLGQTGGRNILQGESARTCASQPGRDDLCCITVANVEGQGSGVVYRDTFPTKFTRYVLAHEIGHYVGLCHWNRSADSIMYTIQENQGLKHLSITLLRYVFKDEPDFTLVDGKNTWRFLVSQMARCLSGDGVAVPVPVPIPLVPSPVA